MLDELTAYLVSLLPALTAIATVVGGGVSIIRSFKKATGGQSEDVKAMRRENKQLNADIKELAKTNKELAENIKVQSASIKSMQGQIEVLLDVKEEQLQQKTINKDMDR